MTTKALAPQDAQPLATESAGGGLGISAQAVHTIVRDIELFQKLARDVLVAGVDWGWARGTGFMLRQPGASKVIGAFNCYSDYEIIQQRDDEELLSFVVKSVIRRRDTQDIKAVGIGAASTHETKHRYRWVRKGEAIGMGYSEESLAGLKSEPRGETTYYRVDNPEWQDLLNTVLSMACTRADRDAAKNLPGVATELVKIFDAEAEWMDYNYKHFWMDCRNMGFSREDVHRILKVASVKHWEGQGHTLDEAKLVLSAEAETHPTARRPVATVPTPSPPSEAIEDVPDVSEALAACAEKIGAMRTSETGVAKWWRDRYKLEVSLADFEGTTPPDKFTFPMLSRFLDALLATEQKIAKEKAAKDQP